LVSICLCIAVSLSGQLRDAFGVAPQQWPEGDFMVTLGDYRRVGWLALGSI